MVQPRLALIPIKRRPWSPAQWTQALSNLLADRKVASLIGAAGRALVEARYSITALAPRLAGFLRRFA